MATAIDNIGRKIDTTNMTLAELKSMVGTLMGGKVGPARPAHEPTPEKQKQDEHIGKLRELFEQYTKSYTKEVQDQKSLLQRVVDSIAEFTARREEKKADKQDKPKKTRPTKEEKSLVSASTKLQTEFHKTLGTKGSGWVHDPYCEKVLLGIQETLNKAYGKRISRPTVGNPAGPGGPDVPNTADGGASPDDAAKPPKEQTRRLGGWSIFGTKEEVEAMALLWWTMNKVQEAATKIQKTFMGFDSWQTIIGGAVDKEREFTQAIRDTAYQVEGVTKESRIMQRVFEDIGDSSKQTGMDRTETQKFYNKALRSGVKDQKIAIKLVNTQLNAEKQLGLQAGALNDTFMSWHQAGRMNNVQLAQMNYGMREIARNTGLTGEALEGVVKGSEEFIRQLRNAANLTAAAALNVLEIGANAKKLGIESEMQPLMRAMTSSNALLTESSRQTQAFLMKAATSVGRMDELLKGTVTRSKKGIRDMAQGMRNNLREFGIESLEQIDQLSDDAKFQLNMALKATYGMELGQVRSAIEAMEESGKGMGDRLNDIQKQRDRNAALEKAGVLTQQEALEENIRLAEKERQIRVGANKQITTSLSEATKGAKSMDQALATFGARKKDFAEDLKTMGLENASDREVAQFAIAKQLEDVNAGLKKAGKQELNFDSKTIENALASNDPAIMNGLLEKINKAEQELATAQQTQLDPMKDMEQHLREINDNIRQYTQSLFSKMFNSVIGKLIALGGTLLGIAAGIGWIAYNFGIAANHLGKLGKVITKKFGSAAHGAAQAAEAGVEGAQAVRAARGPKFLTKIQSRMRRIGRDFEKSTAQLADNIAVGTEKFAQAPLKNIGQFIKDSWIRVFEGMKDGAMRFGSGMRRVGIGMWEMVTRGVQGAGRGIGQAIRGIPTAAGRVWGLMKEIPTAFNATVRAGKAVPGLLTKGIGGGLSAVTKLGGKATSGLLKLAGTMNPVGLAVMAAFVAIDGLTGILDAGAKAADYFGKKKMEEVTLNEEYAAKTAGFLISILNGLTFGILGMVVDLDKWTAALARFNAKVPILTIAFAPLIVTLEFLWGVIKGLALGIWEILKGLWDGIMEIVNPLVDGISDIFKAIGAAFGSTGDKAGGLVKLFRELGGVVGIVSGTIKFIGTAIGWVFRIIGKVVGFVVKVIAKLIEGFMVVLEPVGEVLGALWDGISEIGQGIYDVFSGIWSVISEVFSPVIDFFSWVGTELGSLFGGGGGGFFDVVKSIGKWIGYIVGFLLKIVLQPLMFVAKVLGAIGKLIQAVVALFKGDFTKVGSLLKDAVLGIIDAIIWPFKSILNYFGVFAKDIWDALTWPFRKGYEFISKIVTGIKDWFYHLWHWLVGGSLVPDLVMGIITWFAKLPGMIYNMIGNIISAVGDLVSAVPDMLWSLAEKAIDVMLWPFKTVMNFFSGGSGDNIVGGIKQIAQIVFDFLILPFRVFGKIVKGIGKVFKAIGSIFKGDFKGAATLIKDALLGVVEPILNLIGSIWDVIKKIPMMLWDGIKNLGGMLLDVGGLLLDGLKAVFIDFPLWLGGKLLDGLKSVFIDFPLWLGGKLLDGLKAIFVDFPVWLWDTITSKLSGFGNWLWDNTIGRLKGFGDWLWDTFTGTMQKVMDFVLGLIPGAKTAVAGFTGTAQENAARREKDGNSVMGGLGAAVGGVLDLDVGKTFGGVVEAGSAVLEGIADAGSAVLSAINPFNWFAEGTRQVENTGIGVLHKNEMVIPAKDVEKLSASGDTFGGAGNFLQDMFGGITDMLTGPQSLLGSIGSLFSKPEEPRKESSGFFSDMFGGITDMLTGPQSLIGSIGSLFSKPEEPRKESGFFSDMFGSITDMLTGPQSLIGSIGSLFGGVTEPSEKAIDQRLDTQASDATFDQAKILNELWLLATTKKGLLVRDPVLWGLLKGEEAVAATQQTLMSESGSSLNMVYPEENTSLSETIGGLLGQGGEALNNMGFGGLGSILTGGGNFLKNMFGGKPEPAKPAIKLASPAARGIGLEDGLNKKMAMPIPGTTPASTIIEPTPAGSPAANNVSPVVNNIPSIQTEIAKKNAEVQTDKTEIVAPELAEIAEESNEQTVLLGQMVKLFEKFIEMAKPKSESNSSSGGEPGDTATRKVIGRPNNYYRSPIGKVGQTAGKAILNIGIKNT